MVGWNVINTATGGVTIGVDLARLHDRSVTMRWDKVCSCRGSSTWAVRVIDHVHADGVKQEVHWAPACDGCGAPWTLTYRG